MAERFHKNLCKILLLPIQASKSSNQHKPLHLPNCRRASRSMKNCPRISKRLPSRSVALYGQWRPDRRRRHPSRTVASNGPRRQEIDLERRRHAVTASRARVECTCGVAPASHGARVRRGFFDRPKMPQEAPKTRPEPAKAGKHLPIDFLIDF